MAEVIVKNSIDWIANLQELKEYADRARFAAWTRWNESWRIYNNQFDWSEKADWQAKNYIPKITMTVEMAASLVRRAMIDAEEYFSLEGTTTNARKMAPFLEKLCYYYLDLLRFTDNFSPPLKGGLVGSLIVVKPHLAPYALADLDEDGRAKIERGESVEREVLEGPAITLSYPDPYNIWLDPAGHNLFVLEEEELDLATAFDLVDMRVLEGDAVRKVREDWVEAEKQTRESTRRQQSPESGRPNFRRRIKLTHFWGSMPTIEGRWAIRNGHYVMLNDKYVGREAMDNPYAHKQLPYIIGSPFRRPFSVYHKGLIEDVVGLQKAMTELLNLTLDASLFAGIKAFEVDLDQIEDPQQLLSGIYPGKVFTKRAGGQNTQMIRDITMSGASRETLGLFELLNNEFQNSTAVTEFISGAASQQGARTATEIITKQHQGMGIFGEMGRNLEGTVLEPMIDQLASLIAQYHDDFTDPQVMEILGEDLALELMLLGSEDRTAMFDPKGIRVRATGITTLLNRTEEISKITGFLQQLGQFGPGIQTIFQSIDAPYFFNGLFKRLVRAFGWNEKDFIRQVAPAAPVQPGVGPVQGGGVPPAISPGQSAPPPVAQTQAQMDQIRSAISGGGMPPSGQGG